VNINRKCSKHYNHLMMKKITTIFLIVALVGNLQAQKEITEQALIIAEGTALYKTEMASWHGTDVFREQLPEKMSQSGGYFSYPDEQGGAKCVFYDLQSPPKAFVEMFFDSTYNVGAVQIDTTIRDLTGFEKDLYTMRMSAIQRIQTDTIFKHYNNTSFNIIPLIRNGEKKVFVLTGPQVYGVVIFGNDYQITFNDNNEIVGVKQIHQNIIPIEYDLEDTTKIATESMHSHLPETGDYITSTDICTLMLYSKFTGWKQHTVVSRKYMNMWFCESGTLALLPMETVDKIDKDQKQRKKKREKSAKKKRKKKKRKSKN